MDELRERRFHREIENLRKNHHSEGLGDPMKSLGEIAARAGVDVDTAIKAFLSDGQTMQSPVPPQAS